MKALNQTLRVSSNKQNRTFTIRTYIDNVLSSKYRTSKFSKQEFIENENNTSRDWSDFLQYSADYYLVK